MPLTPRVANPEAFQAAVQLMKLQLRHRVRLSEVQYAPVRIWSFPALREVFLEPLWNQRVAP
jgi:hypothetical protein